MNRSTFCEIKYKNGLFFFKGQVYDWGWFQNTGSHTRTKSTRELPPGGLHYFLHLTLLQRQSPIRNERWRAGGTDPSGPRVETRIEKNAGYITGLYMMADGILMNKRKC